MLQACQQREMKTAKQCCVVKSNSLGSLSSVVHTVNGKVGYAIHKTSHSDTSLFRE